MEELNNEIISDLKLKLRTMIEEKDKIVSGIKPMKIYITEFTTAVLLCDIVASGILMTVTNSALGFSKALLTALSICTICDVIIYPIFIGLHRDEIKERQNLVLEKEEEINKIISVIKEQEKKEKIHDMQNKLNINPNEKQIIREEDFIIDYYTDDINNKEETSKVKTLGVR